MKNEMDLMGMDERRRLAWLKANRTTLFIVGFIWIGMIGWEMARGLVPWFLIVMVPVIAMTRFLIYRYHMRKR